MLNELANHYYSDITVLSLEFEVLAEQINAVEEQIEQMVEDNEDIELLKTIPGVGKIGAATIASYTENIERFDVDFKRFAFDIRTVPSVLNSNKAVHL